MVKSLIFDFFKMFKKLKNSERKSLNTISYKEPQNKSKTNKNLFIRKSYAMKSSLN